MADQDDGRTSRRIASQRLQLTLAKYVSLFLSTRASFSATKRFACL
jgi:hypothetical protein